MRKIILKFCLLICSIISIFTILFLENINVHAYDTDVLEDVIYEEEYQYQPTIDDNFEDDKIIVTIKEEYSAVNKVFNLEDFVIENLIISDNIDNEITDSECVILESLEDLTYVDDPSKIVDNSKFSQIFSLNIKNKSKENVLKATNYLSKLDFVQSVEPSYIYETVDLFGQRGNHRSTAGSSRGNAPLFFGKIRQPFQRL